MRAVPNVSARKGEGSLPCPPPEQVPAPEEKEGARGPTSAVDEETEQRYLSYLQKAQTGDFDVAAGSLFAADPDVGAEALAIEPRNLVDDKRGFTRGPLVGAALGCPGIVEMPDEDRLELIRRCAAYKARVVAEDPTEQGVRARMFGSAAYGNRQIFHYYNNLFGKDHQPLPAAAAVREHAHLIGEREVERGIGFFWPIEQAALQGGGLKGSEASEGLLHIRRTHPVCPLSEELILDGALAAAEGTDRCGHKQSAGFARSHFCSGRWPADNMTIWRATPPVS